MNHFDTIHNHGEESLVLGGGPARLTCTLRGGHVRIELPDSAGRWDSPHSLPPWQPGDYPGAPPLLQVLRGDFFCFPFGVTEGSTYPHGETANRPWRVESTDRNSARLVLELEEMPGRVTKLIRFNPPSGALLQEHLIEGVEGQFNYGHHPILYVPDGATALLSTGPIRFGQVYPHGFAVVDQDEHSVLKDGARFSSLDRVECRDGSQSTLAEYPVRPVSEDLVMFTPEQPGIAWNALSMPGYLWLGLRRTADFPSTLLWMSNGGRPRPPWNGVHTGRIGIEDVCSYFHEGAHRSRLGLLDSEDIPTSRQFRASTPVRLWHLQVVIPQADPIQVAGIQLASETSCLQVRFMDGAERTLRLPADFIVSDPAFDAALAK